MTRSSLALIVLAFACSHPSQPQEQPQPRGKPMADARAIKLSVGMTRQEAETAIAIALGKERADYSPYGNNLRGGTVEYMDATGLVVFEVIYKSGVPAPWVTRPDGVAEHYPPVDESVISFRAIHR